MYEKLARFDDTDLVVQIYEKLTRFEKTDLVAQIYEKQAQRRAAAETASRKLIEHFIHLMHNSSRHR